MKGQHRRVVMSVQMKAKYSIVEMIREATPVEIDYCKLVYCGCGRWKEDHVQKNISKYIRFLNTILSEFSVFCSHKIFDRLVVLRFLPFEHIAYFWVFSHCS